MVANFVAVAGTVNLLDSIGSSSVTAILERRKFLMAEESSGSDSDDGGWS